MIFLISFDQRNRGKEVNIVFPSLFFSLLDVLKIGWFPNRLYINIHPNKSPTFIFLHFQFLLICITTQPLPPPSLKYFLRHSVKYLEIQAMRWATVEYKWLELPVYPQLWGKVTLVSKKKENLSLTKNFKLPFAETNYQWRHMKKKSWF